MSAGPLLEMRHIVKRYSGVTALDDVTFTLKAGEVHCLVGENGAGKSTLIKILSGAVASDSGIVRIGGEVRHIRSPLAAAGLGIGIIHQDFKLVPELSVAENITLGCEPTVGRTGFIHRRRRTATALAALRLLGAEMDPETPVRALSVAQRQIVEIAKALSRKARILAMDEPTASLSGNESAGLFSVVRRLKEEGTGVIYISHRLEEVFEIGDRITVLRDGKLVDSRPVSETSRSELISRMVGREIEHEYPHLERRRGKVVLQAAGLNGSGFSDISLEIHAGEIFGLAGLVGAGRTGLARVLFGADQKRSGRILLDGREIAPDSPNDAIRKGIGLLTEDRNRQGLILQMSVRENISLASLNLLANGPFIRRRDEEALAGRYIDDLNIRPPAMEMKVENLSGGNRQKVVLARWLTTGARLLIFDEPTAGIDVGARYEIYVMINRLAQSGVGVLMISSDLPELLGLCDRIAVMCRGRMTGVLARQDATQEKIMALATAAGTSPGASIR